MSIYDGITPRAVVIIVFASFGGLLFGFDNGWWGSILGEQTFLCDYGTSTTVDGVTTCTLSTPKQSAGSGIGSAGIMIGCAAAIWIPKLWGRKFALLVAAFVSVIGCVIEMTSAVGTHARYSQFIVGKIINSIAMGLANNVIPIYLSETAVPSARGAIITLYQTIQLVGTIVAAGAVYAVSTRLDKSSYLVPMGIQLIAPALMLAVGPFLPESPRWLMLQGRTDEAIKASNTLFFSPSNGFDAEEYCRKLAIAFEEESKMASQSGWGDLFRQPDLRRVLIAIGIQSLQSAQGASYMTTYIVSFLAGTGVTNVFPIIMALYCVFWVAGATGYYTTDTFGRRFMLMLTAAICGACLIIVAILTTVFVTPSVATSKASIALIFIWYFFFGAQGPIIWIVTAEASPTRNRERIIGSATFCGYAVSLVITFVSPYLQDAGYGNMGSKIGFLWGAFSIITVLYVFFMIPEFKGLSLEQIDYLFDQKVATRKFGSYKFTDDVLFTEKPVDEVMLDAKDKELEP